MKDLYPGHSILMIHGNFKLPDNFQGSLVEALRLLAEYIEIGVGLYDTSISEAERDQQAVDILSGSQSAMQTYFASPVRFVSAIGISTWDGSAWKIPESWTPKYAEDYRVKLRYLE